VHTTNELSSVDPTIGLRYRPVADVTLRVSYGTGFVAPAVGQLFKTPSASQISVIDPKQGNIPVTAQLSFLGGNPDLRPEESESFSAGIIVTPRFLEGFRLSVDYTRIAKSDNITQPTSAQQIVDNEDVLPGRVVRGPDPTRPSCTGISATTICSIDVSAVNLATAEVEAYDVQLDYGLPTATHGRFDFFALATWQTHYRTQFAPLQPVVENVGIGFGNGVNPLKLKANAGLTWQYRAWTLGWTARYFHHYFVADPSSAADLTRITNQGNGGRVPSQTYHDLTASYSFGPSEAGSGWTSRLLGNTEIRLAIDNVFNKQPPFDASNSTRYYSPFGDPRLASYSLTLRKSF
jgi:outer membrane receptor protein involved in Fe transport